MNEQDQKAALGEFRKRYQSFAYWTDTELTERFDAVHNVRTVADWLAAWEARGQDIPEGWDMVSKRIATACREAIHPNGMSVHRGTVVLQANDVLRLLNMASPQPSDDDMFGIRICDNVDEALEKSGFAINSTARHQLSILRARLNQGT